MQRFGSGESGFSIELRGSLVVVRAWGFWDAGLACQLTPAVLQLCRAAGQPLRLLLDGAALKPQGDVGQMAFRDLIAGVIDLGLVRAAVLVRNILTKMQLMRITNETKPELWVYIGTEATVSDELKLASEKE